MFVGGMLLPFVHVLVSGFSYEIPNPIIKMKLVHSVRLTDSSRVIVVGQFGRSCEERNTKRRDDDDDKQSTSHNNTAPATTNYQALYQKTINTIDSKQSTCVSPKKRIKATTAYPNLSTPTEAAIRRNNFTPKVLVLTVDFK